MKKISGSKIYEKGLSLIEILVVITIFAVLGVVISGSIVLTIQGTKKSESLMRVRENLNYSLSVIERNIRNADSIPGCPYDNATLITFIDQEGVTGTFSCVNKGSPNSYIASGSARLTPDSVKIMECGFTCVRPDLSKAPMITINVAVQDASASGVQSSNVSTETQIYLRN